MGFAARSLLLLSVLYSLVFVVGDFALLHRQAPIWAGVLFVIVLAGAQYLSSPWMRMRALNREAVAHGRNVSHSWSHDPHAHRTGFPVEFFLLVAPLVCAFLIAASLWMNRDQSRFGIMEQSRIMPWLLVALGITWAARIGFRYHGTFQRSEVKDLVEDQNVSQMRPRAVEVEGEIVSRGMPGAFWSPDLMLEDETGSVFLYYRSSIPLGRLFFAFHSANRFVGERVRLQGWYRGGDQPYIELSRIEAVVTRPAAEEGSLSVFRQDCQKLKIQYEILAEHSYSRWIQLAVSAACTATGIIWLLGGF
jgi:hypothetical protein